MKRLRELMTASPLKVMVLAAVGFAVGIGIAVWTSRDRECFLIQPAARAWVILMGANVAAWLILIVPTIQRLVAIEAIAIGRLMEVVLTVGLFGVLFTVPLLPPVANLIGAEPGAEDYLLLIIGGLIAGVPMLGIWRVHAIARQLQPSGGRGDHPPPSARLYLSLQDHLQAFLWTLGVIISLGTLALGLAVQALNQEPGPPDVPSHVVWAYGLYFTAVLALSYGPTYIALMSVGRSIRDTITGDAPVDPSKVEDWLRRRQDLGGLLQLSQGPLSNIKSAILVVSPLLSSLLTMAGFKS